MNSKDSREVNFERLRELIELAKGKDRSLREYARDAHIDHAALHKIMNGKYKPGIAILRKLACEDAKPQNGVTLYDFLLAAGHPVDIEGAANALRKFAATIADMIEKEKPFWDNSTELIENAFRKKRYSFATDDPMNHYYIGFQPDRCFMIHDQPISNLWLKFWVAATVEDYGHFYSPQDKAADLISAPTPIRPDPTRKTIIVLNSPSVFKALKDYTGHTSFRGWLSAILIDTENNEILEEILIASHEEGKKDPLPIL